MSLSGSNCSSFDARNLSKLIRAEKKKGKNFIEGSGSQLKIEMGTCPQFLPIVVKSDSTSFLITQDTMYDAKTLAARSRQPTVQ